MKVSRRLLSVCVWLVVAFAVSGPARAEGDGEVVEAGPDRVVVQHILIGFKRSVPGQKLDRTKKEAEALARELFQRAKDGEDFLGLVKEYSADGAPGILPLVNTDAPRMVGSRGRDQVVPGFGDAAFALEVGEIGLVEYSFGDSPYGWHIIKRLE